MATVGGSITSLLITGIVISGWNENDYPQVRNAVYKINFIQNCIITIFCVLFFFLIKEKPVMPASAISHMERDMNFKVEIRELCKNKSYVFLAVSFTILFGFVTGVGNILSPLFIPFGYSSE